jgi:hypothetical protein
MNISSRKAALIVFVVLAAIPFTLFAGKISERSSASTPLTGSETVGIIQGGLDVKTTVEDVRKFCESPCAVSVPAHRMPGTSVTDKINAAIASLPSGVGGIVDARGFANPVTLSGFTITPGVTVLLGPVFHTLLCNTSITVQQGGHLIGSGRNSPGGTTIRHNANCSVPMIKLVSSAGVTNWWHNGSLKNIRLDGQKAFQTTANNCVESYLIGETSVISELNIVNCKGNGVYLTGSNSGTGTIRNVTVNSSDVCGFKLENFTSAMSMLGIGGDNNPVTLCILNSGGGLQITDFKSEKTTVPGPAVTIGGSGSGGAAFNLTIVGGNALQAGVSSTTFLEIHNTVTVNPTVTLMGMVAGNNYTTMIDDQENSVQVSADPLSFIGLLSYVGGKSIRFDKNGFVTVP